MKALHYLRVIICALVAVTFIVGAAQGFFISHENGMAVLCLVVAACAIEGGIHAYKLADAASPKQSERWDESGKYGARGSF